MGSNLSRTPGFQESYLAIRTDIAIVAANRRVSRLLQNPARAELTGGEKIQGFPLIYITFVSRGQRAFRNYGGPGLSPLE